MKTESNGVNGLKKWIRVINVALVSELVQYGFAFSKLP
jgi:hypothetical protein